ncbi:MAG TPA: PP2C family serine/threonine-protein phosphatase [Pyrinomonadaceae bacterium]
MTETAAVPEWRVIGETVPGASHLRAGLPNQDAILQVRESGRGLPLVVSVSDGHGSHKCFRSHRGSRFAVRRAAQLVGEFLDERRGAFDEEEIARALKETVPREFVRRWREAVEADLKARPFAAEELEALERKDGARARKLVEENPLLAYGATSLTVAVEESFILYLQLGDGEILCVSESGEVSKALAGDSRLFANETTSLCTADAEKNFRTRLQTLAAERPALVLVTTDGYANSFADEAGFLKVGSDLLEMLRADGIDPINASLKGWLEEATRAGSGDDTTLAIVCRVDALKLPQTEARTKTAAAATAASETKAVAPETKAVVSETNDAPPQTATAEVMMKEPATTKDAAPPVSRNASASALANAVAPPIKPRGAVKPGERKSE